MYKTLTPWSYHVQHTASTSLSVMAALLPTITPTFQSRKGKGACRALLTAVGDNPKSYMDLEARSCHQVSSWVVFHLIF